MHLLRLSQLYRLSFTAAHVLCCGFETFNDWLEMCLLEVILAQLRIGSLVFFRLLDMWTLNPVRDIFNYSCLEPVVR